MSSAKQKLDTARLQSMKLDKMVVLSMPLQFREGSAKLASCFFGGAAAPPSGCGGAWTDPCAHRPRGFLVFSCIMRCSNLAEDIPACLRVAKCNGLTTQAGSQMSGSGQHTCMRDLLHGVDPTLIWIPAIKFLARQGLVLQYHAEGWQFYFPTQKCFAILVLRLLRAFQIGLPNPFHSWRCQEKLQMILSTCDRGPFCCQEAALD